MEQSCSASSTNAGSRSDTGGICRLADKFWNTPGMTEEQGVAEFQKAYDSVF